MYMTEREVEERFRVVIRRAVKETESDNLDVLVHHISREPFYSKFIASDTRLEEFVIRAGLKGVVLSAINNNSLAYDDTFDQPPFTDDGYLGLCPKCHRHDGMFNVEGTHWTVCHAHKVRWSVGFNLFSGWRDETEEKWEENSRLLSTYEEVAPYILPAPRYDPAPPQPGSNDNCPF